MKSNFNRFPSYFCLALLSLLASECRAAALTDGSSSTLSIALSSSENLSVVANATTYTFSSNQNFTNGGVTNASDFSAFGTTTLTLQASGIARYSTLIQITDSSGASSNTAVTFNTSINNTYSNNITIALTNAGAGAITFSGATNFTGSNALNASTTKNIACNACAVIGTNTGNLTLTANPTGTTA